jgi:hypothetical protein
MSTKFPCRFLTDRLMQQHADCLSRLFSFRTLLILAAIVDTLLAVLLIAVSGFIFGPGPESSNGDPAAVASWAGAVIGCIAAPVAAFVLRRHRRAGIGVLVALTPPAVALFLTLGIYQPY